MNILYCGASPNPSLTQTLDKQGYTIVLGLTRKAILASLSTCDALVLHWKSKSDQQFISRAQAAGLPIMVITDKLVDAYTASPLADLYLEEPARDDDIAALLIDMVTSQQSSRGPDPTSLGIGQAA
jgi:hypothetical protein